jgi:hypothetical protein
MAGQKSCSGTRKFVVLLIGVSSMVTPFPLRPHGPAPYRMTSADNAERREGISSQASQSRPVADPKSHTPVSTPAYPRRVLPATYKSDGRPHSCLLFPSSCTCPLRPEISSRRLANLALALAMRYVSPLGGLDRSSRPR